MTNAEEIEIRIKSIEQLFNSLDPAPFRERELDRELEEVPVRRAGEVAGAEVGAGTERLLPRAGDHDGPNRRVVLRRGDRGP